MAFDKVKPLCFRDCRTWTAIAIAFLVSACQPWGDLNNPVDPASGNYAGYPATEDCNSIEAISPADGASFSSLPKFVISELKNAKSYELAISTNSYFSPCIFDQGSFTANSMQPTSIPLSASMTYYWKGRAMSSTGTWGKWTNPRKFICTTTNVPVLNTPSSMSTQTNATPTFTWSTIPYTASYDFVLSQDKNSIETTKSVSVSTASYTPSSPLANGNWYWRVRSIGTTGEARPWAETQSFTESFTGSNAIAVRGVSLDKTTLNMSVGTQGQLTATITPSDASNKTLYWSSSSPSIATVDTQGLLHAIAQGYTTITVTSADGYFYATCMVNVASNPSVNIGITSGICNMTKIYLYGVPSSISTTQAMNIWINSDGWYYDGNGILGVTLQWYYDGAAIVGATSRALTLGPNLQSGPHSISIVAKDGVVLSSATASFMVQ